MNSSDNITHRRKKTFSSASNKQRSLSNESIDSLSSDLSIKSMMDLSTHFKTDEIIQLRNENEDLKQQLLTAHAEIEHLNQENTALQKLISDEKQKNEQLKRMYITSMSIKRSDIVLSSKLSRKSRSVKTDLTARKLDIDTEFGTPISRNTRHVLAKNASTQDRNINRTSTATKTTIGIQNDTHTCLDLSNTQDLKRSPTPQEKDRRKPDTKALEGTETKTTSKSKSKLIVLADNQGEGIIQNILNKKKNFIITEYDVIGFRKTDAKTSGVLSCCNNLSQTLTKQDHVVIMTGCNDTNLLDILSELNTALNLLKNCNVYIIKVMYNAFLKEKTVNSRLRSLANSHKNCVFIDSDAKSHIVAQNVIHHVNKKQYHNTFLTFPKKFATRVFPTSTSYLTKAKEHSSVPFSLPRRGTIPYYFQKIENVIPLGNKQSSKHLISDYFPVLKKAAISNNISEQFKNNHFFRN